MMQEKQRVRLRTFQGQVIPAVQPKVGENYWMLVGACGQVLQVPKNDGSSPAHRYGKLLIKFDVSIPTLSLHCHNEFPNSLWILESDLECV